MPGAAGVAIATLDLIPPPQLEFLQQPQLVLTTTVEETSRTPLGLLISSSVLEQLFGAPVATLKPGTLGKPLRGVAKFTENPAAAPARNVVAVLPGSDPRLKGEYVAIGAHNDHLGFQPARRGGRSRFSAALQCSVPAGGAEQGAEAADCC